MSHPIVRMFHEQIRTLIDKFSAARLEARPHQRTSLVVILRAVPVSGESTFAAFLKMYAESIGLEAQICSADSFFVTERGYAFNPDWLGAAHHRSQVYCNEALARGVPVVIIDNTNVTRGEWMPYSEMVKEGGHSPCRVNFNICLNSDELAARSWHNISPAAMTRRVHLFCRDDEHFLPHYEVAVRTDPFTPQDDEEISLDHPIERMFFTVIAEKLQAFKTYRDRAHQQGKDIEARRSCVFVLRGLPGCGKSTFALQTKIFARAMRLDAFICSSDDFPRFRSRYGFHFDPNLLHAARTECLQKLRNALFRHVPVIVVDDANITAAEWEPIVREASLHHVQFVNFMSGSEERAAVLLTRSFTHCSDVDRAMLLENYRVFNESTAQLLPSLRDMNLGSISITDVLPIFNLWDDTPEANRASQP